MSEHTKGPWHAVGAWVEHESHDVADICICDPVAMGQSHLNRSQAEVAANARLIATAPAMLKALRSLVYAVESFTNATPEDWFELAEAHAVIKQAEGEV